MNSKYENMSLKEIIRQIEKKDKRIKPAPPVIFPQESGGTNILLQSNALVNLKG